MKRPLQVLVLDDDEKILRLLKIFLRQLGYQVTTAPNGREGIQIMLESSFDLIIVDLQMPVVDGFEFAEEALRLWPWEKIVICTGHITPEVEHHARSLGIRTILEKPLSFNTLESAIQEVCGNSDGQTGEDSALTVCSLGYELSQLRTFTHEVTSHHHFGKTVTDYARVIQRLIPCAAAGVFAMEGDYNKLSVYSEQPVDPDLLDQVSTKIRSHMEFFEGEALPTMPGAEAKSLKSRGESITADGHYTLMVPVPGKRDARGILFVILAGEQTKPPPQLNQLMICAHHLATLLEMMEQFHEHSIVNPLTGLYTKVFLDEQIKNSWELAKSRKHPMGLLSLDLNEFKAVNDEHGFPAGDEVLRKVAECIQNQLQSTEIAARRGGDEFCVLMPDADPDRAQALARTLVTEIGKLNPVINAVPIQLSASIGLALTVEGHGITSSSQLTECAEHARFVAKRTKNTPISSWTELKESGQASYNLHPVLVVDDDPQIIVLIKRLLNKNMYDVTGVGSVAEAISLLEKGNRYEVLLTDLALPHQDGTEMMRLGQEIDSQMVCVVISGNISKDSDKQLRQRGAFDVVKKPFVPDQLRAVVSKSVDQHTRNVRKSGEYQAFE
ncbi:response regulator [Kiritimatiellaeota bacterium B1221]|nr:response regulator [Kiritimatiellaeota bacterium B1221]